MGHTRYSSLVILLAVPWALFSGGCLSKPLWDGCYRQDSLRQISGVLRSSDGKADQLVVSYAPDASAQGERFFVVPLSASGLPDGPFLYRGEKRTFRAIVEELCTSNVPIESVRLKAFGGAAAPNASPSFRPFNKTSADSAFHPEWRGFYCAAFRRDSDGVLQPVQGELLKGKEKYGSDDLRWPPDCFIVVLPANQPGPAGERAASCVGATLLLPIDIAVTLAFMPIAATFMLLGHSR
jgi:hypothetical protein